MKPLKIVTTLFIALCSAHLCAIVVPSQIITFEPFSYLPTTQNGGAIAAIKSKIRIALFDTSRNCRYVYQPLIDMAQPLNIQIDYYSIGNVLDADITKFPLAVYDGAFFILCSEFLKTMQTSPASEKILNLLENYAKQPKKLTGLMFPPMNPQNKNMMLLLSPVMEKVGINVKKNTITIAQNELFNAQTNKHFFNVANQFLSSPIERRKIDYHTTLNPPRGGQNLEFIQTFHKTHTPLAVLPIKQKYPEAIKSTLPYGIYFFNPARKNHLLISNASLLSFAGISENFQLYPINVSIRTGLQDAFQETMWELSLLLTQDKHEETGLDVKRIFEKTKPALPNSIKTLHAIIGKTNDSRHPKKTAWMEISCFEDNSKEHKAQQTKLVDFILDSKLDSLWLSISPNMYYSPIGKEKQKKEIFLKTLGAFTKQLSTQAKKQKATAPELLIGFEIANNLYAPNLPKKYAYDIYGNTYNDVPQPLDKTFWKNEITTPLKDFLHDWQSFKVSNGIKIKGIVIDFEMYCRKTTGAFLPTMGFSFETAKQLPFTKDHNISTPNKLAKFLIKTKQTTPYFQILEAEAKKLGHELRQFIRTELPNSTIGCYAPNISTDWFYKGIYKGLSTPKDPIYLLTFNAEFYAHKKWLEDHSIQAKHASVLMLSKLKNKNDFNLVDYILQRHDGIWLNRFSRLVEPYHNDWSTLEQTPMNMDERTAFIKFMGTRN